VNFIYSYRRRGEKGYKKNQTNIVRKGRMLEKTV